MEKNELDIVRRAYAKHVMAAAGVADERVETAFATVPREQFLGPGPVADLALARRVYADPKR